MEFALVLSFITILSLVVFSSYLKTLLANEKTSRAYQQGLYAKTYTELTALREELGKYKKLPTSEKRSKSIMRGKGMEHLVPLMVDFPYKQLSDLMFVGTFCDFIYIPGYSDMKDGIAEDIKEIVFIEIKSGKAQQNKHQRAFKKCIEDKNVRFEIFRVEIPEEE